MKQGPPSDPEAEEVLIKDEDAPHQIKEEAANGNDSKTEFAAIKEEVPSGGELEEVEEKDPLDTSFVNGGVSLQFV